MICLVCITLNEEHNLKRWFDLNVWSWATHKILIDSGSDDNTVSVARKMGFQVYRNAFDGFGSQWAFALSKIPSDVDWAVKLDPDEDPSPALVSFLENIDANGSQYDGFTVRRELFFMGGAIGICDYPLRIWRPQYGTVGTSQVNEHIGVSTGNWSLAKGTMVHLDSPNIEHWIAKQIHYASLGVRDVQLGLQGHSQILKNNFRQRLRNFLRHNHYRVGIFPIFLLMYYLLWKGLFFKGRRGIYYSFLRTWVFVIRSIKIYENP